MTVLTREWLLEDVRRLFSADPRISQQSSKSVGAELELIPVKADTGARIFARGTDPSGEQFVEAIARKFSWTEEEMSVDPSCWTFSDGKLTFEPGGQIEFSSAVFPTAGSLVDCLDNWLPRFAEQAARMGVELKTTGIDGSASVDGIPLQLQRARYRMMTRYFDTIGAFGVTMMRQTASLQINVDRGENPGERWRLLNSLAPYLVAIFANSPVYENRKTGHQSYRAHVWRQLDPLRTGITYENGNDAERYLEFALNAPVILSGDDQFPSFSELLRRGGATIDDWETHLSTLFPEIRPREYFEIRSIDAIPPKHIPAAIAFVAGIVYSRDSASRAYSVTGDPDPDLLVVAGKEGLRSPIIRQNAVALARIAMDGCEELGDDYLSQHHLERARAFFEEYTTQGRSPADDTKL